MISPEKLGIDSGDNHDVGQIEQLARDPDDIRASHDRISSGLLDAVENDHINGGVVFFVPCCMNSFIPRPTGIVVHGIGKNMREGS